MKTILLSQQQELYNRSCSRAAAPRFSRRKAAAAATGAVSIALAAYFFRATKHTMAILALAFGAINLFGVFSFDAAYDVFFSAFYVVSCVIYYTIEATATSKTK